MPSKEADRIALPLPLPMNLTAVMGAAWAENVIKQKPDEEFQSFTTRK